MHAISQQLLPPVDLILQNSIGHEPNTDVHRLFDLYGRGLVSEIVRDCGIGPESRILDLGCGLGRLARPLTELLSSKGRYVGLDVNKSSIEWCAEHYHPRFSNFRFIHADVHSTLYNSGAARSAANYSFPLADAEFDCVFSTSLFTHLMPDVTAHYLSEIARVLKPGGITWNTFLLLDEISEPLCSDAAKAPRQAYLAFKIPYGRVASTSDVAALVGTDISFVTKHHEASGLTINSIRNGPWSGRIDDLKASYQDVVIAMRHAAI